MSTTNTLQRSVNFASIFTRLNPLSNVGSIASEPALTIGDFVRQMIMGPPFAWRWNRKITAFLATTGTQDYVLADWTALTGIAQGRITLDPNGNQQVVTVGGTTGATQPTWATTLNALTTDGSVTWANKGSVDTSGNVAAMSSFGWLEKAVAVDANGAAYELEIQLNIAQSGTQNQPFMISSLVETTTGRVLMRIQPPPDQNYKIYLTYQQAAPNFTSLSDPWAPVPDYLSYLYNQGYLAKTYEYLSDERFAPATQMFVKFLVAANEGLDESQVNIFLNERMNTLRQTQDTQGTAASARAGRSLG